LQQICQRAADAVEKGAGILKKTNCANTKCDDREMIANGLSHLYKSVQKQKLA
jgi:hypothetical protein